MFLLGQEFAPEQKKRNFDYYDPLTTGDSSLSVCIQSILASEIGYADQALEYFRYAVLMDLADIAGNVEDGIHIASIGGTWMALVYGFAGMRDYNGNLFFNPRRLPDTLDRVRFPLTIRGQVLQVDMDRKSITYSLREGDGLVIRHEAEEIRLSPGTPVSKPLHVRPTVDSQKKP
jgi:alpha,alpha-trehalose phosphorylase